MMNDNLQIAIKACFEAGKAVMDVYNNEINVQYKDDASPLTQADTSANDVINTYLKTTNIPIISEENAEIAYETRKHWNQCWVVDPLDGTKEFIKRNGEFTINIALVRNQKPILGVVYAPVLNKLYFADVAEQKAHVIEIQESTDTENLLDVTTEITPSKKDNLLRVVTSRSHIDSTTLTFIEKLKDQSEVELISKGSSLKFCLVAEGEADIYPRFAPTMEWDTAAAHAVCNAVGITVMSHPDGEELVYNKKNLRNPWFLCSQKNF